MTDFFRFPHTAHLAWLGPGTARDDKVLSPPEVRELLSGEVVVEEKVDGANLGLSLDPDGRLLAQNRGKYLERGRAAPQFKPLGQWLEAHAERLSAALAPDLMLFGEWCYAVHSVRYARLPDWFLAFDVYDRGAARFWSVRRRDELARRAGVPVVPMLARGQFDLAGVRALLGPSRVGDAPAEGVYVRREDDDWLLGRAKLVRPEFVQAIGEHWSKRRLETNALASGDATKSAP